MRRRFDGKAYDEINITPLMDTVFFLLIIFMITAPLLEYSVDVSPPSMTASKIKEDEFSKVINIRKDGTISFENKTLSVDALLRRLNELKKAPFGSKVRVYLRGDKQLLYGRVIDILRTVKKAGHGEIALITEGDE